jgi:hypothetical protein
MLSVVFASSLKLYNTYPDKNQGQMPLQFLGSTIALLAQGYRPE